MTIAENIETIIFDLGGVILNLDNQRTEDAFTALGVKDFKSLFGHGHAASFFKDYEIGLIDDAQFLSNLKELGQLEANDDAIREAWNVMLLDFPAERIELLRRLRQKYRVMLFSNNNSLHLAAVRHIYRQTFGQGELDDHFERSYYSHILGQRKPELAAFRYILHENGLVASNTLFVDDALINVEAAIEAGLQGLYLSPGMTILDVNWRL